MHRPPAELSLSFNWCSQLILHPPVAFSSIHFLHCQHQNPKLADILLDSQNASLQIAERWQI
jgi:hypothetical protein